MAFQPVLFVCRRLCLLDTGTCLCKIPKNFEIPSSQNYFLLRMLQPLPRNQTQKMPLKTDHIRLFSGPAVGLLDLSVGPNHFRDLVRNHEARHITEFDSLA